MRTCYIKNYYHCAMRKEAEAKKWFHIHTQDAFITKYIADKFSSNSTAIILQSKEANRTFYFCFRNAKLKFKTTSTIYSNRKLYLNCGHLFFSACRNFSGKYRVNVRDMKLTALCQTHRLLLSRAHNRRAAAQPFCLK
jgi:hypothetical protein